MVVYWRCILNALYFECCFMLSLCCVFIVVTKHLQYKSLEQASDGGVPVLKRGCIEYDLYVKL